MAGGTGRTRRASRLRVVARSGGAAAAAGSSYGARAAERVETGVGMRADDVGVDAGDGHVHAAWG